MAYTTYPEEARRFRSNANILNEKLNKTENDLKDINTIFKVDTNEDYLTLKTIEATEELINMVAGGESLLEIESGLVTQKANQLENEARELEEAREKREEEITEIKEDE